MIRRIHKFGSIIELDNYRAQPAQILNGVEHGLKSLLARGYSILQDSLDISLLSSTSDPAFTQSPKVKIRILALFLGRASVRRCPEFPRTYKDLVHSDLLLPFPLGLRLDLVHNILTTYPENVEFQEFIARWLKKFEAKLDHLAAR